VKDLGRKHKFNLANIPKNVVCHPGPTSFDEYNTWMMHRRDFGQLLRRHREALKLSAVDLATKTKLALSVISNLECGQRQAGPIVAERLLRVLKLSEDNRQEFLVAALKTTASEILPQHAKKYDPELYRLLWGKLDNLGVVPERFDTTASNVAINKQSSEPVKNAALLLAQDLEAKAAAIRNALESENIFFHVGSLTKMSDGGVLMMELNTIKSGGGKK